MLSTGRAGGLGSYRLASARAQRTTEGDCRMSCDAEFVVFLFYGRGAVTTPGGSRG
jgi:hypothetical protein